MITAKVKLKGTSPISFSKRVMEERPTKEQWASYEKRTWKNKMHVNDDGNVVIPAMMVKNCLSEAAKYTGERIEGRGQCTWTKHFEAGIMVEDDIDLKVKASKVDAEWVFVPSDGKRGGASRVDKCFPVVKKGWTGEATICILDEVITKDIFEKTIKEAGRFIGLGRFRPRNNGQYGRFEAEVLTWTKEK